VRILITGGAGFIGSNLADALISRGDEVIIFDNFSTGHEQFLNGVIESQAGLVIEGDIRDEDAVTRALDGCDQVIHLAANADVRHGLEQPRIDLEQNTLGTFSVLSAMRKAGVNRIMFSSTGSVYGEPDVFPTPENCPFPRQTSLYGASKLAGEGLIQAFCEGYGFAGIICRFVSILGPRYTHGHLFDFYRSLIENPDQLTVLGDGRQTKSYLHITDCVNAMLLLLNSSLFGVSEAYNLGTDEVNTVDDSLRLVTSHLGVEPAITKTATTRGWIGDSPLISLECSKLRLLGWVPMRSIPESITDTLEWFDANRWIFESTKPGE
jgi:UDP-glucose 4-epimerase